MTATFGQFPANFRLSAALVVIVIIVVPFSPLQAHEVRKAGGPLGPPRRKEGGEAGARGLSILNTS